MPRLAFEEPKGGPRPKGPSKHRREEKRDGVVVALKAATFAVVAGLIGLLVFLATSGDEQAVSSPDVPKIPTSRPATTTTTPPAAIVVPEVRRETAQLTPTAVPPPSPTTNPPAPPTPQPSDPGPRPGSRFAVVGAPCEDRGAYAFTVEYEPVVCGSEKPSQPLTWHKMF